MQDDSFLRSSSRAIASMKTHDFETVVVPQLSLLLKRKRELYFEIAAATFRAGAQRGAFRPAPELVERVFFDADLFGSTQSKFLQPIGG